MDDLLLYKNSPIRYRRFGTGSKMAFCIHGYGQDAGSFSILEKFAGDKYSFYAIDLPFHGQTTWKEGLNFNSSDLLNILNELPGFSGRQITLIGYSLGGRIALSLYEAIPQQVEKMILLAPDGLKVNFWYWLTTQTSAGNRLFQFTMEHPGWFFTFLKTVNKLGLVNASVFKFVNHYIGDKEVRSRLYERWTAFRKLKPSLKEIKTEIRQYHTPVQLIYGKYDRIILPSRGEEFRKGIEDQCSLKVINSGHQILQENNIREILPVLLDDKKQHSVFK
ncbi:MAG: alpha/beta hydrolase [Chitinophagales bacterium]|nr:alpha/beta hydrolase [Chitinophagales bacterium]